MYRSQSSNPSFGPVGDRLLTLPSHQFWNVIDALAEDASEQSATVVRSLYHELRMLPRNSADSNFVAVYFTFLEVVRHAQGEETFLQLANTDAVRIPRIYKGKSKRRSYLIDSGLLVLGVAAAAYIIFSATSSSNKTAAAVDLLELVRLLALRAVCVVAVALVPVRLYMSYARRRLVKSGWIAPVVPISSK